MIVFQVQVSLTNKWQSLYGFLSFGFLHFRIGPPIPNQPLRDAAEIRAIVKSKRTVLMDKTKRRSMQPMNQELRPKMEGWTETTKEVRPDVKKRALRNKYVETSPPLQKNFRHKFYGGQLIVGSQMLIGGLNKQLHTLEITGDKLYIDNTPQQINPGELERIKNLIRKEQQKQ